MPQGEINCAIAFACARRRPHDGPPWREHPMARTHMCARALGVRMHNAQGQGSARSRRTMCRDRAQPGVGGLSRTGVGGRAGGLEESRHRGGRARGGRVVRAAAAVRSRLPGTAGARSPSDHARQPGAAVAQWSGVASRCVRASTMRGSLWKRVPLVSSPLPRDIMMCVARASCRTRSSTRAWARRRPCLGPACAAPARTARAGRCSWPAIRMIRRPQR